MSWDGNTISCGPPLRETPGFGCPGCAAPLPTEPAVLRRSALYGLPCCGYLDYSDGREARRWVLAAYALEARA